MFVQDKHLMSIGDLKENPGTLVCNVGLNRSMSKDPRCLTSATINALWVGVYWQITTYLSIL